VSAAEDSIEKSSFENSIEDSKCPLLYLYHAHYSAETKLSDGIRNSTLSRRYLKNKDSRAPVNAF
jgi:hypothetical protein